MSTQKVNEYKEKTLGGSNPGSFVYKSVLEKMVDVSKNFTALRGQRSLKQAISANCQRFAFAT